MTVPKGFIERLFDHLVQNRPDLAGAGMTDEEFAEQCLRHERRQCAKGCSFCEVDREAERLLREECGIYLH
jgi:hypothetical protein